MARLLMVGACALLSGASVGAVKVQQREATQHATNPIRKVVTMLQDMQKKVTEEGKREEELYHKFMCYCSTNGGELSTSIEAAKEKIEAVSSSLKSATERGAQTEADLTEHQGSRAEAEDTMAKATALREKEASEFSKEESDLKTNVAAIAKAVTALEKGAAGAFLQTNEASLIRSFAMERAELPDSTRQELLSFLSGSESDGYSPQGGEITGILKQMGDEMSKSLSEATDAESSSIANYEALLAAKKKEVATLQSQIETEMERIGRLGVESAEMANDIEDTQEALSADEKFSLELESSCKTKTAEWDEIKKTRTEELLALAETITVLNDDDALELFKKTLPGSSASLVQLQVSEASQRARALVMLKAAGKSTKRPELDLIALALRGKTAGFEKVLVMIDEMVVNLKKEQVEDDSKKIYCDVQLDEAEDKKKGLERTISDTDAAIEDAKEGVAALTSEIKALGGGIVALDKSVVEGTDQRKVENTQYKELMSSNGAAKELLGFAKNRLNKFYNPSLYKAAPKQELSAEDRIVVNNGGTPPPTEAPGGIADTGIAALVQVSAHNQLSDDTAPAPPPATWGAYSNKSEENNGVVAMIDLLIKDLEKEMTEAEVEEKNSQTDYEALMLDSAEKRAQDSKSLAEKESTKADLDSQIQEHGAAMKAAGSELMATDKYISNLHAECDWLVQYFEVRKTARADEIDSLGKAKAVLSGADYALLQTGARGFLSRRQ
mmetsp:Transcript_21011/g.68043  ORF Transcript_21011/g.68043 Transcript_21011/m.68043 type:complete len:728 (+) Transcript_21011:58-2241(+)